jgi:hypothetical protein
MGRDPEARHVDPDDAHPVDLVGKELEGDARGGGDAEVGDHHGVVRAGSASWWTASRMSSKSLPVTRDSGVGRGT